MATGNIFISEYTVTPTLSGQTTGTITVEDISGGTAPYTIQWYGPGPHPQTYALNSGSTFNPTGLSAGTYSGRVIDYVGLSADTEITVSAFTAPQFSATVSDNGCIDDPNLPCTFTVWSAGTDTAFQSAATFNYTLYKNGELVKEVYVSSATTSPNQGAPGRGGYYVFSGLTNGEYVFNISTVSSHIEHRRDVRQAVCTGSTIIDAGDTVTIGNHPNWATLSSMTSAWTMTNTYCPGQIQITPTSAGQTIKNYTTGIFKNGIVTDSPNHWLFTGNSQTGALNYPTSNPNSGRTTIVKNYYLGVTGATDMQEGYNWGPSGGGGHPLVDGTSKDLDGAAISGAEYDGYFYYNNNIQKFVMFRTLTGTIVTSLSTMGWQTLCPSREDNNIGYTAGINSNSGSPTSSLAITTAKYSPFWQKVAVDGSCLGPIGNNDAYPGITNNDVIQSFVKTNPALTEANVFTGFSPTASASSLSFVSSCQYNDYTLQLSTIFTGNTTPDNRGCVADIVLAQMRDTRGLYGMSGQTHQLVLRISESGTSVMDMLESNVQERSGGGLSVTPIENNLQFTQGLTFQRDLHGDEIILEDNHTTSDVLQPPRIITKKEIANRKDKFLPSVKFDYSKVVKNEKFGNPVTYVSEGLQTKEFNGTILGYPEASVSADTSHTSPYRNNKIMKCQGAVRIRITRSGSEGEQFRVQMTDSMGENSIYVCTTKDVGDTNEFNPKYEMNFNLLDKTTWSGSSLSAPSWVIGNELVKYLGATKIGFKAAPRQTTGSMGLAHFYDIGLTGNTGTTITPISHGEHPIIFSGTAFTLTSTATTNVITTKNCDYYNDCEYTVPKIKPQMDAIFQSLPEPDFDLSGGTLGNNLGISGESIYNLSAETGMDLNIFLSGNTADFINKQAYLKLDVYPYEFSKEKFSLQPDYRYVFDVPARVSTPTLTTKTTPISASTFFPFSAFSTGTSWQFLIKPSSLFRDKSDLTNNVYIDTSTVLDKVTYDRQRDSIVTLVEPPREPSLRNQQVQFASNVEARLESEAFTVTGVPEPTDINYSAFTWSGAVLSYNVGSSMLVSVNGVTVREEGYSTTFGTPSGTFVTGSTSADTNSGDYRVSSIRGTASQITFRGGTLRNGDVVNVIYPLKDSKSYWKQTVDFFGTITTNSASTIYRDSFYYYINLDYPALGAVGIVYNGQILVENSDFQRVGNGLIQLLTITYDNGDLNRCSKLGECSFTLYYLTQYTVVGRTSTKEPTSLVTYTKTLGFKESLKQMVYNYSTGEVVQENYKFYKHSEFGGKEEKFKITVPSAGTYNYRVIATRYYPLFNGEEITTSRITPDVRFEVSRQTFFSPYKLPGQRQVNNRGGY